MKAACVRCGKVRTIKARRLCHSCYTWFARHRELPGAGELAPTLAGVARKEARPWSAEEKAKLRRLRGEGKTFPEIAQHMNRPADHCRAMCHALKIPVGPRDSQREPTAEALERMIAEQMACLPRWWDAARPECTRTFDEHDDATIRKMCADGYSCAAIGERLGAEYSHVSKRAGKLGIKINTVPRRKKRDATKSAPKTGVKNKRSALP